MQSDGCDLYKKSINDIYKIYETSIKGLSRNECTYRLSKYGCNVLPKNDKDSLLKIFISQFVNPLTIILIIVLIFSFVINEVIDGCVIAFIVLADAIMGTIQEWKANKSAKALESMIEYKVKVKRNNSISEIDSALLVPGDIIELESGNKICADARIIVCNNLTVDESILSGESAASLKSSLIIKEDCNLTDRNNMLYAGTSVLTGRCEAIVLSTGKYTEIGKIASTVISNKSEKSPLMIRMDKFTKQISVLIVIISIIIYSILKQKGMETGEILLSVVALSISAMPEGLTLALTLALTIGSDKMASKGVIVKKLNAVESLGSCTVIATDKTGTLTVNEQTAKKIVLPSNEMFDITGSGYNDDGVLKSNGNDPSLAIEISKLGVLNNEAGLVKENKEWKFFGDSIDVAFLSLGYKLNVNIEKINIYGSIPYESENKYSSVFYEENSTSYCTVKGSFEKILSFSNKMCVNGKEINIDKERLSNQNEELSSQGYRVIAIAKGKNTDKKIQKNYNESNIPKLTFMGFVAFIDPIRKEIVSGMKSCKNAGIKVVMITGDHPLTAFSIAKELNLASSINEITTGDEIDKYFKLGEKEFDKFVSAIKVFTRVNPMQKLEIVDSFKRQGEFVAVTGDGVNDAPALKSANIGVSIGSGSDVAKETSSMIITDDNFMSIVSSIKEGRIAYSNIRKVIYLLLSCGVSEVLFFMLSIIFNYPMPLVAVQLLWLNIVTDGLQDLSLSFEREEGNIMNEKPRNPKEGIFDKLLASEVLVSGIFSGLLVFIFWTFLLDFFKLDVVIARSYVMALMVFIQNFHVLNCKSEKESIFKYSFKKNKFIIVTIILSIALQILVMEVPILSNMLDTTSIPLYQLSILLALALPIVFVMEIFKKIMV